MSTRDSDNCELQNDKVTLKVKDVQSGQVSVCNQVKGIFETVDGFNDEDLEKPNFAGKPFSDKIPFVLSAPGETPVVQVPATINQYLRKYQQLGIAFLYKQYCSGRGAILADDMGLGKTVQVIGFMSAILGKSGAKSDIYDKFIQKTEFDMNTENVGKNKGAFLIVSPHSVLYNWFDELMTWGYFKVGKFHRNKRDETLEKAAKNKLDVVLTTYETLRKHWESLNKIDWLALIMDEVHHLKDPKAAATIAAKSLNVKCRIGLTGTPLQNRILEFWCVLDWANPGCLGKKENFIFAFGKPILQGQRFDVTKRELATGRKKTQEFQMLINKWCLRRTKSLIADQLPKKDQKVVFCPLSKLQEDIYKTLLQTPDVQLVLRQSEPCDCGSELSRGHCCYSENEEGFSMKQLTLQYLRLLLKVSNHAALLLPQVKQTEEQRKRASAICEKVFSAHPYFKEASKLPSIELFSDSNFCGKMKVLDELLKLFQRQKDKVLLFSYSTQLLDILESYVVSCGMVYRRLDGKTRGEQRLSVVREFNTVPGIFLFLISTKAGGVGLNLTSANVVVVFDPSWNPADDLQAEDRAYRIGQRKDVKVFRMISGGTVEENMYLRQVYKQQLANVAVEGNNERRYFTAVEGEKDKKGELFGIENLFTLRNDGCCMSSDIFMRSDTIERGFKMAKYELQPKRIEEKDKLNPVADDGEDNRYDLDEVTSQIIGDEGLSEKKELHEEITCDETMSNKQDETTNVHNNTSEHLGGNVCDAQAVDFTKVKDVSEGNDLRKRCQDKEAWKIRKNLKKTRLSNDSKVNQILADCGVQHTHSNKSIIGASNVENEMTARAIKEVFKLGQSSQQPANCFTTIDSDGEESDDIGDKGEKTVIMETNEVKTSDCKIDKLNTKPNVQSVKKQTLISKIGDTSIMFGKTPKAIRLRQFSEIAQSQGYMSEVDFAKDVVSSSTTDRVDLLKKYYMFKEYPVESSVHYSCKASLMIKNKSKRHGRKSSKHVLSSKLSRRSSTRKLYNTILKQPTIIDHVTKDSEEDSAGTGNDTVSQSQHLAAALKDTSKNISSTQVTAGECVEAQKAVILEESEVAQSSSFLDVFLYECSERTRSKSGERLSSLDKNPHTNIQSSIFDDLI